MEGFIVSGERGTELAANRNRPIEGKHIFEGILIYIYKFKSFHENFFLFTRRAFFLYLLSSLHGPSESVGLVF